VSTIDDRVYRTYCVEVTSPRTIAGAISPTSQGPTPAEMLTERGKTGFNTVRYRANSRATM